jgi:hypothetical protein
MTILLPALEADRRIRRAPWLALAGLVLMVLSVMAFRDVGFVTGLMLLLSSGAVMGFRPWLRERGLWMLAALTLVVFLALAVMVEYDTLKQNWNAPAPRPWWKGLDPALGAVLLWRAVRLLLTIVVLNRRRSRAVLAENVPDRNTR